MPKVPMSRAISEVSQAMPLASFSSGRDLTNSLRSWAKRLDGIAYIFAQIPRQDDAQEDAALVLARQCSSVHNAQVSESGRFRLPAVEDDSCVLILGQGHIIRQAANDFLDARHIPDLVR